MRSCQRWGCNFQQGMSNTDRPLGKTYPDRMRGIESVLSTDQQGTLASGTLQQAAARISPTPPS